ncbi:MAG: FAD-dependent monooxygenase [Burkholderiales bacterium]|nr:FAD-dependent monooxygenase [Burkholderiales bacterium]
MKSVDVAVAGAGLVGLAFARAAKNLSVAVLAPRPAPSALEADAPLGARIYAVSPGNVEFLRALRVWQHVPEGRVAPVHAMQVHGDDGRALLEFDAYRAGVRELAWIVEDAALQAALWRALEHREGCEAIAGARCTALEACANEARLRLEDGRILGARLVVAADGADSPLRTMAGIEARVRPYGQSAVVANFACAQPHGNVARQWFQGGPILALLPLPGRQVSMVWSLPERAAASLMEQAPEALCGAVEAASGGAVGALSLVGAPHAFPLRRIAAHRIVAPRVALIGDAAHVVHPLAGQGANLGFQDARVLAEVLAKRAPVEDIGALGVLRRYERARAEPVRAMDSMVHGLYGLFGSPDLFVGRLRNFGLNLTGRLPVLRNLLVRQAIG